MTSELANAWTLIFGGWWFPLDGKQPNLWASTNNEIVAFLSPSPKAQIALKDRHKKELAQRIKMRRAPKDELERVGMLKIG